ncbi:serine/threonine-protein kinase [Skeletonema marinoi]|uniref:Serine/threonine-protein kinase n=1 Tax=Skeletonema marinoi TaxID=267567 RepID=A0AAD8YHC3_9STRA|nr:serine/threonine-protein kinase [Skeletonema marinoi]
MPCAQAHSLLIVASISINDEALAFSSSISLSYLRTFYLKGKSRGYMHMRLSHILCINSSLHLHHRDGYLKITDFGFSKIVTYKTFTLCGTPEYIAPEVLLNKGHGKGVDWWTLGILIYEMIAGEPPFIAEDDDPIRIYQQVLSGTIRFTRSFDKTAKQLTKKLLTADLTRRLGCLKSGSADIRSSRFFDNMDFDALLAKQLPAPIIPCIKDSTDTSNFDSYPPGCVDDTTPPEFDGEDPFLCF